MRCWVESAEGNGVEVGGGGFDKALHGLGGRAGGDEGGGSGGVEQAFRVQIVSVGVARAFAAEDANAAAGAGALAGGFDDLLVDSQSGGRHRLEVEVGVVAAGAEGLAQAAFKQALGDGEFVKKITLVTGAGGSGRIGHRMFSLRWSEADGASAAAPFLFWCGALDSLSLAGS